MIAKLKAAQHSAHLTLGSLRQSQAVFYALAFPQWDGFAVPALVVEPVETQRRHRPTRGTPSGTMPQTVGEFHKVSDFRETNLWQKRLQ